MNTSLSLTTDNNLDTLSRIDKILQIGNREILNCNVKNITFDNILNGKLGLANYCNLLYKLEKDDRYLKIVEEILENIFEEISLGKSYFSTKVALADGVSGLGIVLHHLIQDKILDEDYINQVNIITNVVYKNCLKFVDQCGFDYFYGAIGLLFYLYEVEAFEYCEKIIDKLYIYAAKNNFMFYNKTNDVYTQGINFGFAHGSLSIISILMRLYEKGIGKIKAKELILRMTDNLIKYRKTEIDTSKIKRIVEGYEYPSFFPYNIITTRKDFVVLPFNKENKFHYTDRLGWCNSDLGHILTLYKIGVVFNKKEYSQLADTIGKDTVKRLDYEDTAISDCHMCHGSSGVAQLYNKIYKITKNDMYREPYEYWINVTIKHMEKEIKKPFSPQELELLTGWLGPLLTFYTYKQKNVNGWDNIFLL